MAELATRYGVRTLAAHGAALQAYSETLMRRVVARIPPGEYLATDYLDDDGFDDGPVLIRVAIRRRAGSTDLEIDFSGSSPQRRGPVNAVGAVTLAAALYVMRCLSSEDMPMNEGAIHPLQLRFPGASVVSAEPPAAVAAGNVETSQRIVDVLFRALARALPDAVPAASQGTMNNLALGGWDRRRGCFFAYYETMGGGAGARPGSDGASGVHDHMSNTLNTPVEALESAYPLRVLRYEMRRDTGGRGRYRGGDGLRRDLLFLAPADVTILSERRRLAPYGLQGGEAGARGENALMRAGTEERLAGKEQLSVQEGDVLSLRSPGGGALGRLPAAKEP
jgi:N-methylhydantoinase B